MNVDEIKGIIVPLLTPVDSNENIDEEKLRYMVNYVIDGGVHGILAFGSNGEFYMFDEDEQIKAFTIILDEVRGRVPVYFGIGAIRTRNCIRLAKEAIEAGAEAISILQPMFLKPTDDELYDHFKAIADAVPNTKVLLYNNPGRTGYTLSGDLVEKLAHTVTNIVGMKDSSGDFTQLSEFIRRNRDIHFKVLAGKDTMIYGGLCVGTVGSVCTTANVYPELVCAIYNKFIDRNHEGSLEDQFKLNPIRLAQDKASFPVATKDMANLLGLDIGEPVKPNKRSEGAVLENMKKKMREAGYIN